MPWTEKFIEKYTNRWDWFTLSGENYDVYHNYYIFERMDLNLVERFSDNWDWLYLAYHGPFYKNSFAPYLDDELVEAIMKEISS